MNVKCVGTGRYPGCLEYFEAPDFRTKFCPACMLLDRKSSFVFVQRRELRAERETEEP